MINSDLTSDDAIISFVKFSYKLSLEGSKYTNKIMDGDIFSRLEVIIIKCWFIFVVPYKLCVWYYYVQWLGKLEIFYVETFTRCLLISAIIQSKQNMTKMGLLKTIDSGHNSPNPCKLNNKRICLNFQQIFDVVP